MAKREAKSQPQAVKAYVDAKGWNYVVDDKEENYKVETCVFCQNESSNFEVHIEKGFFKTWCCSRSGSFYELKKELGDAAIVVGSMENEATPRRAAAKKEAEQANFDDLTAAAELYHEKLYQRPEALQYLKARGFNEATIDRFKLGCAKRGGELWITIPHYSKGKAVNIKYRGLESKAWEQEKGSKKILFNEDVILPNKEIIITEGELKSVALVQVGIENTVSFTGGVSTIKPEWIDQLEALTKVYICMDSDEAGQKGAQELANRLGLDRCYNIVLEDAKDPDEWLFERKHTADEFRQLMRKAKQFEIKDVVSLSGALGDLYHDLLSGDTEATGIQTPWESVNRVTKGFKAGELIILSAPPKMGKTSLALNIAHYNAKEHNLPVGFFCMEMSAKRLSQKIIQQDLNRPDALIDASDVAEARYRLRSLPLYFLKKVKRGVTSEDIFEAIKLSYRRYGLKLIVFDNLHFLIRGSDKLREQIGEASQQFKLLAEELGVPIILIVHPRKLNGKNRAMTADDFKESSSIHADADQVIMMHRNRKQADELADKSEAATAEEEEELAIMSPETDLIVDASRFTDGGKIKLWFYGAISKFVPFDQRRQDRLNGGQYGATPSNEQR